MHGVACDGCQQFITGKVLEVSFSCYTVTVWVCMRTTYPITHCLQYAITISRPFMLSGGFFGWRTIYNVVSFSCRIWFKNLFLLACRLSLVMGLLFKRSIFPLHVVSLSHAVPVSCFLCRLEKSTSTRPVPLAAGALVPLPKEKTCVSLERTYGTSTATDSMGDLVCGVQGAEV